VGVAVAVVVVAVVVVVVVGAVNPTDSSTQMPEKTVRANKMATHRLTLKNDIDGNIVTLLVCDS